MNVEQFETMLKSMKEMSEEQLNDLMATLQQHVLIPNHWTKTCIEEIAGKSIDEDPFKHKKGQPAGKGRGRRSKAAYSCNKKIKRCMLETMLYTSFISNFSFFQHRFCLNTHNTSHEYRLRGSPKSGTTYFGILVIEVLLQFCLQSEDCCFHTVHLKKAHNQITFIDQVDLTFADYRLIFKSHDNKHKLPTEELREASVKPRNRLFILRNPIDMAISKMHYVKGDKTPVHEMANYTNVTLSIVDEVIDYIKDVISHVENDDIIFIYEFLVHDCPRQVQRLVMYFVNLTYTQVDLVHQICIHTSKSRMAQLEENGMIARQGNLEGESKKVRIHNAGRRQELGDSLLKDCHLRLSYDRFIRMLYGRNGLCNMLH